MGERKRSYEGLPERLRGSPEARGERGSSGGGSTQLPTLTNEEFIELRHWMGTDSIRDQAVARRIAAKVTDPAAFQVFGEDIVLDIGYVVDHASQLFNIRVR